MYNVYSWAASYIREDILFSNWGILNMECVSISNYLDVMMVLWLHRRMSVLKRTWMLKNLVGKYCHVYNWLSNSSLKYTFVCVCVCMNLYPFLSSSIYAILSSIHPPFHQIKQAGQNVNNQWILLKSRKE